MVSYRIHNPIRYRGYYYDTETKLYYLNARYYSPEWRRFIQPADTSGVNPYSINGLNLYTYEFHVYLKNGEIVKIPYLNLFKVSNKKRIMKQETRINKIINEFNSFTGNK